MPKHTRHSTHPAASALVSLLARKGIRKAVVSSGSRNAPLTIELSHSSLECYSIIDERCAAFFALGMAKEEGLPVALVCTSGSAVLDYYPGVAEAFYSRIPLVVISADRPCQWTDQAIGQTIRQDGVLHAHTVYNASLREGSDRDTLRYNAREINAALDAAREQSAPVHINVPFSEPLYDTQDEYPEVPKVIHTLPVKAVPIPESVEEIRRIWREGKKKMVLIGCHRPDERLEKQLEGLCRESDTAVLCETTSNLHSERFVLHIDQAIIPLCEQEAACLHPDVLVTCGGMVVSKKVKAFLKASAPRTHIHISRHTHPDTYMALTHRIEMEDVDFFGLLQGAGTPDAGYAQAWEAIKAKRRISHSKYCAGAPFSDFRVWEALSKHLPAGSHLEVANSAAIRYNQLFPLPAGVTVGCNRGTSGIDGSSSTAAGAAVSLAPTQVTLVSGDLSFFYDSNGLWNKYLPASMRIIVINNDGGGIFRILDGSRESDVCTEYLQAPHGMSAESIATLHGFEYSRAENEGELYDCLTGFWEASQRPKLLEVLTAGLPNDEILRNYFKNV